MNFFPVDKDVSQVFSSLPFLHTARQKWKILPGFFFIIITDVISFFEEKIIHKKLNSLNTECPRGIDQFYIIAYYII